MYWGSPCVAILYFSHYASDFISYHTRVLVTCLLLGENTYYLLKKEGKVYSNSWLRSLVSPLQGREGVVEKAAQLMAVRKQREKRGARNGETSF